MNAARGGSLAQARHNSVPAAERVIGHAVSAEDQATSGSMHDGLMGLGDRYGPLIVGRAPRRSRAREWPGSWLA